MKERFEPYRPQKTLIDVVMEPSSYYEADDVHVSPFTKVSSLAPNAFGSPRRLQLQPIRPGTFRSDWSDQPARQSRTKTHLQLRSAISALIKTASRYGAHVVVAVLTAITGATSALRTGLTHIKLFPERYTLRRGVQKDLSGPLIRRSAWSAGATALLLVGVTGVFAVTLRGGIFQLHGAHSKNGEAPTHSVAAHAAGSSNPDQNGRPSNTGGQVSPATAAASSQATASAGSAATQGASSKSTQSAAGVTGGRGGDTPTYTQAAVSNATGNAPSPPAAAPSAPASSPVSTPVYTPPPAPSAPVSTPSTPTTSISPPTVSGNLQGGVPGVTTPVTVNVPAQSVQNGGKPVVGTSPVGVTLN